MSRTIRRKRQRHDYYWVLHDWNAPIEAGHWVQLDPRSKAGRNAIARYHSDNESTMASTAPRWYRKVIDHQIRTYNNRMLRRWLTNPDFDPVFRVWHKHEANWSWW